MTDRTIEIDPECGMTVDTATAENPSFHEGKAYYFCAASCKASFDKNPEKFIGTVGKRAGSEGQ